MVGFDSGRVVLKVDRLACASSAIAGSSKASQNAWHVPTESRSRPALGPCCAQAASAWRSETSPLSSTRFVIAPLNHKNPTARYSHLSLAAPEKLVDAVFAGVR
jgi:hypothetical protein